MSKQNFDEFLRSDYMKDPENIMDAKTNTAIATMWVGVAKDALQQAHLGVNFKGFEEECGKVEDLIMEMEKLLYQLRDVKQTALRNHMKRVIGKPTEESE